MNKNNAIRISDVKYTRDYTLRLRWTNDKAFAVEFIRWRWKHGLSLTDASKALRLSRRQLAYYVSGEHAVPRTVLLACKGWEAERQAAA